LKIDSIGIETQRSVVKEEKRQSFENSPYGRLFMEIMKNSYKVHPYQWTPIGEAQYIDEANYPEFMEFYKKYYVPENAVLVVSGDFKPDQAGLFIHKYFGDIPRGRQEILRPFITEPPQPLEVRKTVYDKIQLPAVVYAYHIPAAGTPDSYAIELLQKWLTGGESSQFFKSLVDEQQLAMQVGAIPLSLEDPGLFITYGICNINVSAEDLDKAMDQQIENAKTNGLNDYDFQKIKNQIENDFYSRNSTMDGISASLAEYYTYFKNTNLINTEIDKYNAITRDDLIRVAHQYLKPENRLVLYYLPEPVTK
jgi:predicted Zn-dependent peptidase